MAFVQCWWLADLFLPNLKKNCQLTFQQSTWHCVVASAIYITKACYMIKLYLLMLLSVDICFIYYTASFSVDSISEQNMPSPRVVPKCKGNYTNGLRIHCFTFPKSKHLLVTAIVVSSSTFWFEFYFCSISDLFFLWYPILTLWVHPLLPEVILHSLLRPLFLCHLLSSSL